MANALDAVLQLKAQQAADQKAQSDSILQATQLFNQARQQALSNQLGIMQYKAGLAEKGLVPQSDGSFKYDPSLTNPLSQIMTATKLQADAQTAQNPQVYQMAQDSISKLLGVQQQPQINPSTPAVAINNPIGSASATVGQDTQQPLLTPEQSAQVNQKDVFNKPTEEAKIAQDLVKSEKQTYGKSLQTTKEDFNSLLNLGDNLVASLKASNSQSGGAGPAQGFVGNIAAKLGMPDTGNISAMKAIKRDTALAYSRALVGGARGMATVFNKVLDSLPDSGSTTEQQGSIIGEMNLTAYAMLKAKKQLGLTNSQINKMSPSSLESLISDQKANMTPDETNSLYKSMGERFSNISPRKQIDINGNVTDAKANPISKAIFGDKQIKPQGAAYYSPSQKKYYDAQGNEVK